MDERQKEKEFDKVFSSLLGFGLGVFLLVMYLYLMRFWRYEFSSDPARWSEFGEYVGGTLGGIFAPLAFICALITIGQQRKQINLMRSQFTRDELLRLAANAWKAADDVLNQAREGIPLQAVQRLRRQGPGPVTVHQLLAAAGRAAQPPRGDYLIDGDNAQSLTQLKSILGLDAGIIAFELDQLAECLLTYRATEGSPEIEAIYRRRALSPATWLQVAGFPCTERVKSYFGMDAGEEHRRSTPAI